MAFGHFLYLIILIPLPYRISVFILGLQCYILTSKLHQSNLLHYSVWVYWENKSALCIKRDFCDGWFLFLEKKIRSTECIMINKLKYAWIFPVSVHLLLYLLNAEDMSKVINGLGWMRNIDSCSYFKQFWWWVLLQHVPSCVEKEVCSVHSLSIFWRSWF